MLTVSNIPIKVIRKSVKNMQLAVYPPMGDVRITAPPHYTESNIRLAVVSRLQWIKQQQERFIAQARQTQREMVSGETCYLWGQAYELRVTYQQGKHSIRLNGRYLELSVRPNTSLENRLLVLSQYYRQQLKARIPALLDKWQIKLGVQTCGWGVRRMKTKWGSCNTRDKRIWLNLELAKKPLPCLEYVLVHELAHLLEGSHNHKFVAILDEALPAWKSLRKILNDEHLATEIWK